MARRTTQKANASASLDVRIPHPYVPIAESHQQSCAECLAVPTDATFDEHHAVPTTKAKAAKRTTAKRATAKKPAPKKASKAERVRALLDEGKTVNEVAKALDDVSWSYAWDVAAAWGKKTGKVVIASHANGGAK